MIGHKKIDTLFDLKFGHETRQNNYFETRKNMNFCPSLNKTTFSP